MPIEFHCPFCERLLRTPDAKAGLQAKCPGCGEQIFVPLQSEVEIEETPPAPSAGGDWFEQLAQLEAKPKAADSTTNDPAGSNAPAAGRTVQLTDCPMCGQRVDPLAGECPACGEPLRLRPAARQVMSRDFQYAGFWLRCAAALCDGLVLAIPVGLVTYASLVVLANLPWLQIVDVSGLWIPELAVLLLTWPYFSGMESSRFQATFGKKLLGLVVTDVDGKPLSFGRATARHWSKLISSYCCLLGYFTAGFDDRKQAWHDSIAGCLVLRDDRRQSWDETFADDPSADDPSDWE